MTDESESKSKPKLEKLNESSVEGYVFGVAEGIDSPAAANLAEQSNINVQEQTQLPAADLETQSNTQPNTQPGEPELAKQSAVMLDAPSAVPPTILPAAVVKKDKFAVDEVLGFAWNSMKKYFFPLLGLLICNLLVQSVPFITTSVIHYTSSHAGLSVSLALSGLASVISLAGIALNAVVALGTINLWLKVTDGDTITIRDVYSKISRVWSYMLASFLFGGMVLLGCVCFLIPGIYLYLRFQFYPYFIVESNAGGLTALKASWAVTEGSLAELLILGIINYFIGSFGWMVLLVGAYPAYVIQNIALAKTYRLLRKNTPTSAMPPDLMPLALIADSESPA